MEKSCRDSKMQSLLHAYELGMISDEDKDRYEAHLLECDFCFGKLKEFAPRGSLLAASPKIRQLLNELHRKEDQPIPVWQKLWQVLWPESVPAFLRPAVLVAVLLVLLYPAYLGFRGDRDQNVVLVQEIPLMQTRAPETFRIRADQSVVLTFLCPEAEPGSSYTLALSDKDGANIYREDNYSDADSYSVGRLLLSRNLVLPGTYRLIIKANEFRADQSPEVEYIFSISLADSPK